MPSEDNSPQLEFDLYIPLLRIAFEYQGEHHYKVCSLLNIVSDSQVS
jgi:hypothetical protein